MNYYLPEIVKSCCKIYFKEVNPKKIRFYFTKSGQKIHGKTSVMGILSITNGITTIYVDRKFAKDADDSSITVKIAHELAHVKLKHPVETTFENEKEAEEEVKKFLEKWIRT